VKNVTNTPLEPLTAHAPIRKYPKGQILFYEGDTPGNVYILKKGAIKIYDIDDKGNEKIVHIISPPAIFPAIFFFSKAEASNTFYSTLSDCEVYVVSAREFDERLRQNNDLALYCLKWMAEESHELTVRLASLEKSDAKEKLLTALRFLAHIHGQALTKEGWFRVNFAVSHQLLADMIGVTRESTTLAMKDLQKHHIIKHPKITVLDINTVALDDMLDG
jgi:CRP/FNR family cyclic AMP-dependent transcriptional regulator